MRAFIALIVETMTKISINFFIHFNPLVNNVLFKQTLLSLQDLWSLTSKKISIINYFNSPYSMGCSTVPKHEIGAAIPSLVG